MSINEENWQQPWFKLLDKPNGAVGKSLIDGIKHLLWCPKFWTHCLSLANHTVYWVWSVTVCAMYIQECLTCGTFHSWGKHCMEKCLVVQNLWYWQWHMHAALCFIQEWENPWRQFYRRVIPTKALLVLVMNVTVTDCCGIRVRMDASIPPPLNSLWVHSDF